MTSRDETWRQFVADYDIDVPESAIQAELDYITLEMRHRMQYDRLSGGDPHLFPGIELERQADELRAAAVFEAKEPLVLKALIAEHGFSATPGELEAEAHALAEREGSTIELVRKFFGDDYALLARDVVERKAIDWACGQAR